MLDWRDIRGSVSEAFRMSWRPISRLILLILLVSATARAQGARSAPLQDLGRVSALCGAGHCDAARPLLDSLMAAVSPRSPEFPELLFARASLATRISAADSDYTRIVADFPASPKREESLLRLAQQALIGGDRENSLRSLQQLSREYRSDSSLARTDYWMAIVLLEARDVAGACAADSRARARSGSADTSLRTRMEVFASSNCPGATVVATPSLRMPESGSHAPTVSHLSGGTTMPARGKPSYSVQVAAFDTQTGAEELVMKLRKAGLEARVDGKTRPFRVRIGNFAVYADAAKAQHDLKAKNIFGFVAEINP